MYAAERQQRIMAEARQAGRVEVALLAESLGVAAETVRRDLTALERRGSLRRVHGGAIPVERLELEPTLAARSGRLADVKRRIAGPRARRAAHRRHRAARLRLHHPGRRASCCRPTSTSRCSPTRSPPPRRCRPTRASRSTCSAGRVRGVTGAAVGDWATTALDGVVVDVAVMGTNGFSAARGLTTPDQAEALRQGRHGPLRPPRSCWPPTPARPATTTSTGSRRCRRRPRRHRHRPRPTTSPPSCAPPAPRS